MKKQITTTNQSSFIFNVELLVEDKNNAAALEQLLHALNSCDFLDYRVISGIRLGETIDERQARASHTVDISVANTQTPAQADKPSSPAPVKKPFSEPEPLSGYEKIRALMKSNALVRLIINKGLGIKLDIPCRIINVDEGENLITVYHVDEKQVYTFRLNEIEDFS